jgi:phage head maturation protease
VSSPEQAQFLGTTRANVATIARYYRVPPERIGGESGGSLTYANVEQRALDFLTFCLRRWIVTMETALSALRSSTTTVKFNAAALVRTDLLTRYQAHESAIRAGWKLRSEVRELEDLPPIAGIDDQEARRSHESHPTLHQLPGHSGQWRRADPGRPASPVGRSRSRGRPGPPVTETFERGALAGTNPAEVPLTATHPRDAGTLPIGVTVELEERADAAWGAWHVSDTMLGNEVLALATDGVPLGLSVGFAEVPGGSHWSADRQRVTRTSAALDHVAVVRVPAYVGAGVVACAGTRRHAPPRSCSCSWVAVARGSKLAA